MSLDDRLALVCLRAVVQELDANPSGAGDVLARMFGGAPSSAAVVDQGDEGEAARIGRELLSVAASGGNDDEDEPKPAARRRARSKRARRPAPAAPVVEHEAASLVRALEERHGTLAAAAEALGVNRTTLGVWRAGRISGPALTRLREAAHAPVGRGHRAGRAKAEGQEAEAGDEPAPQPDGEPATA